MNASKFWAKVDMTGDCWLWQGNRLAPNSYGMFACEKVRWVAHRFAWTVIYGPIPEKMKVLHRCDNPPCVRPTHLFLGTQLDNVRDMMSKGRGRKPRVTVYSREQCFKMFHYVNHLGIGVREVSSYLQIPINHVRQFLSENPLPQ